MRIFEEDFPIRLQPELLPDEASQVVFFDIETTGFSGQTAAVYLIGCIFCQDTVWRIRQWFLDDFGSEKEMLLSFFDFISSYTWLIHFNGAAFDMPFIEKRLARYRLARSFDFFQSLDLYKEIKPYKKLLKLPGLKQKNLEEFMGIHRMDAFTGGELITVYDEYINSKKEELLSTLLLHNADDLRGMLSILPLRGLALLLQGNFQVRECDIQERKLMFRLTSVFVLPSYPVLSFPFVQLMGKEEEVIAQVPVMKEVMKYFYPNYKDYYYLPEEDQAIHKSVAAYVDRAYRKSATQATCYTKRESVFLPLQNKEAFSPVFKRNYKDKEYFMELTEEFLQNKELQRDYLLQLFE